MLDITSIFEIGYIGLHMILGIAQLLAIVGFAVFGIIKGIKLIKTHSLFKNKRVLVESVACIIVAALSFVFNIGWFRFIMTFMLIPIIQPVVFLVTNLYASKYVGKAPKLRVFNLLFIITYLIFWILLPDFSDVGPSYCLFNLVRNDDFTGIAFGVSLIAGVAHILFFVLQIIQFIKIKKDNAGC